MKVYNYFFAFLFSLFFLTYSITAQAATVTFDYLIRYEINDGVTLNQGDSGDITFNSMTDINEYEYDQLQIRASIPAHSKITFTYSSTGYKDYTTTVYENLGMIALSANGYAIPIELAPGELYLYNVEEKEKVRATSGLIHSSQSIHILDHDGIPSPGEALVFAGAQFDPDTVSSGTGYIINNTDASIEIRSVFEQYLLASGTGITELHYEVSPVPLPAALPLFGLGLAGLAGIRSKKKKHLS